MLGKPHAVKAQAHAGGQRGVEFAVQKIMGHMHKNRLFCRYFLGRGNGLIAGEMRRMGARAQHVQNERADAF